MFLVIPFLSTGSGAERPEGAGTLRWRGFGAEALLSLAAAGLLGVWCVLGVVQTTLGLTGPAGWRVLRPEGTEGAIGMPLPGAEVVTAARRLLEGQEVGRLGVWLVVVPEGTDEFVSSYIRYQLAHLQYPHRVDVVVGQASPPLSSYDGVVAGPGISLSGPWRQVAANEGFTLYRVGGR